MDCESVKVFFEEHLVEFECLGECQRKSLEECVRCLVKVNAEVLIDCYNLFGDGNEEPLQSVDYVDRSKKCDELLEKHSIVENECIAVIRYIASCGVTQQCAQAQEQWNALFEYAVYPFANVIESILEDDNCGSFLAYGVLVHYSFQEMLDILAIFPSDFLDAILNSFTPRMRRFVALSWVFRTDTVSLDVLGHAFQKNMSGQHEIHEDLVKNTLMVVQIFGTFNYSETTLFSISGLVTSRVSELCNICSSRIFVTFLFFALDKADRSFKKQRWQKMGLENVEHICIEYLTNSTFHWDAQYFYLSWQYFSKRSKRTIIKMIEFWIEYPNLSLLEKFKIPSLILELVRSKTSIPLRKKVLEFLDKVTKGVTEERISAHKMEFDWAAEWNETLLRIVQELLPVSEKNDIVFNVVGRIVSWQAPNAKTGLGMCAGLSSICKLLTNGPADALRAEYFEGQKRILIDSLNNYLCHPVNNETDICFRFLECFLSLIANSDGLQEIVTFQFKMELRPRLTLFDFVRCLTIHKFPMGARRYGKLSVIALLSGIFCDELKG
eukprot:Nk52_evm28s967 gene=Nk52_evmTU28s967